MTRALTKEAQRIRNDAGDALDIAVSTQDDFATEVRAVLKRLKRKLPAGSPITTRAIDHAVEDARRAYRHACVTDDQAYADRCQHLSRVVQAMVAIERIKLSRDLEHWINRHFGLPEPRLARDEAAP
jgi:hypothetical protein